MSETVYKADYFLFNVQQIYICYEYHYFGSKYLDFLCIVLFHACATSDKKLGGALLVFVDFLF